MENNDNFTQTTQDYENAVDADAWWHKCPQADARSGLRAYFI